ncbi:MAG: LysO family transporter [Muribaculaceae bacterium]|nr:LysO family transporter [Muribaculaceae bacterium]MDE6352013.1 LysO family transporter [Muribaculaceae bacterium]MDE6643416.1 LysO family transporter [Muribaculaceae bacterium]MDE7092848.1 LysO family transporter [Muribaculaceae bacterium]
MFIVISAMFAGIGVGFLLRRFKLGWLPRITMCLILLLLFLLGLDVGSDEHIIKSIPTLGAEALLISLLSILFSCIAAWILWRICGKPRPNSEEDKNEG